MKALKIGILSLITLFFGFSLSAQDTDWSWAKQAGGTSDDYSYGIALDSNGNSYVTGYFQGSASFGSTTLSSSGGDDIFIAKLDSNGNWLWARRAGGSRAEYGREIAVDNNGDSYVTGSFYGSAIFGSTSLMSPETWVPGCFIAKLDSNGNWLWAKKVDASNSNSGSGIAVDSVGNSYVTGYLQGSASFGSTTFSSVAEDIFIAKLDGEGNWLWAKKAGGSNGDYGKSIAVDSSGNSYVTGNFFGSASFGNTTLNSGDTSFSDIFIAKLDSNGNWLWANKAGGLSSDYSSCITVDSHGNSYVTGAFQSSASFGSTSLSSSGYFDIFVAKLDVYGNWLWAERAGDTGSDYGRSIAVDIYGNAHVTGYFNGSPSFGSTTLISSGIEDIFIARYGNTNLQVLSPNGGEIWRLSTQKTIYWDAAAFTLPINIKFSFNGGASWIYLSPEPVDGTLGRYCFTVPSLNSEQCLIRLESVTYPDQWFDVSDGFFTISSVNPPAVTLTEPEGTNLKLQNGRSYDIGWLASEEVTVNLDVSYDWGVSWQSIATELPASPATYNWTVPDTASNSCYLRVSDSENHTTYDWSDNPFTVCTLEIVSQPEAEIWVEATTKTISWTSSNVCNIKLEYTANGGTSWQTILSSYSAEPSYYDWIIPKLSSDQFQLRISDADIPSINDISEGFFSIRPQILLEDPNGGEFILSNSLHRILWDATSEVTQVVLDYSSNSGATWLPIQTTPYSASSGYYDWLVPAITTAQAKVRIRKYNVDNIYAISAAVFSIVSNPVAPQADFIADVLSGLEPLAVQFSDLSIAGTGGINSWHWDFGDGGISTEQNPLYTYDEPGVYSVSLRVEGIFGLEDTELKENYVTVIASVPEIELMSNASLNYGVVYLGNVSPAQGIEVKNIGGAALHIDAASFLLPGSPFALSDGALPFILLPDESAILNVTFSPVISGAVSDSIYIHSDACWPSPYVALANTCLPLRQVCPHLCSPVPHRDVLPRGGGEVLP